MGETVDINEGDRAQAQVDKAGNKEQTETPAAKKDREIPGDDED